MATPSVLLPIALPDLNEEIQQAIQRGCSLAEVDAAVGLFLMRHDQAPSPSSSQDLLVPSLESDDESDLNTVYDSDMELGEPVALERFEEVHIRRGTDETPDKWQETINGGQPEVGIQPDGAAGQVEEESGKAPEWSDSQTQSQLQKPVVNTWHSISG